MSVEYNPNVYAADPNAYLDPTIQAKLENLVIAEEGSKLHHDNVEALLTAADTFNRKDVVDTDESLNHALAFARDRYAKAAAERGSGIWGWGFHGLKLHRTKKTLEKAEYAYRVALDAAGVSAISALEDAGNLSHRTKTREDMIREYGILGILYGSGRGRTAQKGEGQLLAESVETHRLLKVGDIRRDDASANGYVDVTKGWKYRYNRVASYWNSLNVPGKIIIGVGVGAAATAAVVAVGATAPVVALAGGALGISRAALSARWRTRSGSLVLQAKEDTSATISKMRNGHNNSTVARPDAVIQPITGEAKKRGGRNTRHTTIAVGVAAAAFFFAHDIQHGVDYALDHTRHGIDVLEHDAFGHGHSGKSGSGSASSGSTSSGAPSGAPHGGQTAAPQGSNVVEINPDSSSTVYGAFENAPVNVHDWYNAMAAAEHAGALHEHVINGDPDLFYLTTSTGSTSHASVIDVILNYMPKGHFEDSLTHHLSGSALSAHNSDTFGSVTPFADQAAQHAVAHATSNIYPAHVVPITANQESQVVSNVHVQGAAAFPQGINEYLAFVNHYGGANQTNANAYYEAFSAALAQHKLEIGLNQATHQYTILAPAALGHWDNATMAQVQSALWEEVHREGIKTAA